jgi:hypothetical protein
LPRASLNAASARYKRRPGNHLEGAANIGDQMSARPFIPFASDEEIAAIGRGFLDLSLPKPRWTHAAHFAAALWLISCRQDLDASEAMPGFIRAYNEATGVANTDTEGYHETITQASLRAARGFLLQKPGRSLSATCNALMTSPLGRSDWPLAYWTRARLFSVEARRSWVEPDLEPLPF